MNPAIRHWLYKRASKDRENLRLFVLGAFAFFAGLGIVIFADRFLLPSLGQEVLTLAGLVVAGAGGLCAALGYIALSILRIIRLTGKDD